MFGDVNWMLNLYMSKYELLSILAKNMPCLYTVCVGVCGSVRSMLYSGMRFVHCVCVRVCMCVCVRVCVCLHVYNFVSSVG